MSLQLTDEANGQNTSTLSACNQVRGIEASLVAVARGGNAAAFERLVAGHDQRLRLLAQRITHSREDAEDAVQGSLLQAFVHLRGFRGDSPFSAWLTRIVTNEALMHLRKNRRRKEVSLDDSRVEDACCQWELVRFGLSPEEDFIQRELRQIVVGMIQKLQPSFRIVLQLRFVKQLSINATAQTLNLPVSTVKSRLHRARLKLRQILETRFQRSRCSPRRLPASASIKAIHNQHAVGRHRLIDEKSM